MIKFRYIRHGATVTGGTRHERILAHALVRGLYQKNLLGKAEEVNYPYNVRNSKHFALQRLVLHYSRAHVLLVPVRLAVSALLGASINQKIIVVLHNWDPNSVSSQIYSPLLVRMLRLRSKRAAIVAVSPYYYNVYKEMFPNNQVFHYPNLFDTAQYLKQHSSRKRQQVVLGQLNKKNSDVVYSLATAFRQEGINPIMFSLREVPESAQHPAVTYKHVPFEVYQHIVAESIVSLALPAVKEGWSRMAHESLLLGTPVVGYATGGQADLLREAKAVIVDEEKDVIPAVYQAAQAGYNPTPAFIEKYDIAQADTYATPILEWITS